MTRERQKCVRAQTVQEIPLFSLRKRNKVKISHRGDVSIPKCTVKIDNLRRLTTH